MVTGAWRFVHPFSLDGNEPGGPCCIMMFVISRNWFLVRRHAAKPAELKNSAPQTHL